MPSSLEHMIYRFGPFELDPATVELRARGEMLSLEPQVFALLALLVENHDRLVSKDEIIEKVWDGRVVSDAAVASRVKSARQALGDDGQRQRFIRTVRGRGFRFVAKINVLRGSAGYGGLQGATDPGGSNISPLAHQLERVSRPSLAVLPFRMMGARERYPALAGALPDELICELSRLRWLSVTARGSSFRVGSDRDFSEIGQLLGVRYCLSGAIEVSDRRLLVIVELIDTLDSSIVWADRFSGRIDDVHSMRDEIRSRALMALDIQIPMHEANLARVAAPDDLDAWSRLSPWPAAHFIASTAPTTPPPRSCSSAPSPSTHVSHALMPVCPLSTFRPHSCTTKTTSATRSNKHAGLPSAVLLSTLWIRS